MAHAANSRTKRAVRPSGSRLSVVLLSLLAFAFQGYVLQTHIHFPARVTAELNAAAHHHGKGPVDEDPSNCPICQEMLHWGQFVTPSAQVFLPPSAAISTVPLVDIALPFVLALSHSWQGRAPPRS